VIIALLCFIYLTSPIYAGIELKTLSKEEKQRGSAKVNSPWRVNDDQRRARDRKSRNYSHSTRKGEQEASELAMASERQASKASKFQRAPIFTRPQLAKANGRRVTRNGECIYL